MRFGKSSMRKRFEGFVRKRVVRPAPDVVDPEAREPGDSGLPSLADLLRGHHALVTGAGRRTGRATALAMAQHGATVTCLDVDGEAVRRVALEIGHGARAVVCDISRIADIDAMMADLATSAPPVDILVNSASYQSRPYKGILDSQPSDWLKTFETNVFGPAHLTRLMAQRLREQGKIGSIVFIGSVHQWITGGWAEYSASKSALTMLVKEVALELAPFGIRVNAIAPGWVAERDERHADRFDHAPLSGRAIPPEYIARSAVYLAAPHFSAFTTGGLFQVDGGLSLRSYRTPARGRYDDPHVRVWK